MLVEYRFDELELDRSHLRSEDRVILLVLLCELDSVKSIRSIFILLRLFLLRCVLLHIGSLVHGNYERPHPDPGSTQVGYLIDLEERIELAGRFKYLLNLI